MRDHVAAVAACFTAEAAGALPLHLVPAAGFEAWKAGRPEPVRRWLAGTGFEAKSGRVALLPDEAGGLGGAVLVLTGSGELWDIAAARAALPAGVWRPVPGSESFPVAGADAALAWAMAAYRFDRYRREPHAEPRLLVPGEADRRRAAALAEAIFLARDLVSTPTNDLGPDELQAAVEALGARHGATVGSIVGQDLLAQNYPLIHAVGRASSRAPRLLDLVWGEPGAPRLTLVGKGVCFDTGGLDIKPSSAMLMMRKDKGGAALMIGLAAAVMALKLKVRLRLLVPAVENSIAGDAFRPGDVLVSRKGLSVEIGNTDAEGRLILADALAEADREKPDLLLDAATLTGAARVALGPELPALFTADEALAAELLAAGDELLEPLWRLPLHRGYARYIESPSADINNAGAKPFAGAITAALFLQRFVSDTRAYAHLDIFAWNDESRPGRPKGGEATGFRPLLAMIERRFGAG